MWHCSWQISEKKYFINFTSNCLELAMVVVTAELGSNIAKKISKILPFLRHMVNSVQVGQFHVCRTGEFWHSYTTHSWSTGICQYRLIASTRCRKTSINISYPHPGCGKQQVVTKGQTDGQTPDHHIDPAPHVYAVNISDQHSERLHYTYSRSVILYIKNKTAGKQTSVKYSKPIN